MEHTPFETTNMATEVHRVPSVRPQTHDWKVGLWPHCLQAVASMHTKWPSDMYIKELFFGSSVILLSRLRLRQPRNLGLWLV
jgi:hypothetical protein